MKTREILRVFEEYLGKMHGLSIKLALMNDPDLDTAKWKMEAAEDILARLYREGIFDDGN